MENLNEEKKEELIVFAPTAIKPEEKKVKKKSKTEKVFNPEEITAVNLKQGTKYLLTKKKADFHLKTYDLLFRKLLVDSDKKV